MSSMEYWCHTSPKIRNIFFTWTIEYFEHLLLLDLENGIISRPIANDGSGVEFCLWIDSSRQFGKVITFQLIRNERNLKGLVQLYYGGRSAKCMIGEAFEIPSVPAKKYIQGKGLPTSDKVILHCEITLIETRLDKSGNSGPLLEVQKCELVEDLQNLLKTKQLADVTITTADGKMIPVHKNILSARSKVFAAMFKHSMKENTENCVTISDFNSDVVSEMLQFIYTGEAPNLEKMSAGLLAAAEKYELERLKAMCVKFMGDTLSIENAAEVLKAAELYNLKDLKLRTMHFIKKNIEDGAENYKCYKNILKVFIEQQMDELNG